MRSTFAIIITFLLFMGCSKTKSNTALGYKYAPGIPTNIQNYGGNIYIKELYPDSFSLVILKDTVFRPSESSYGFVGFVWKNNSVYKKLWGIDTTHKKSLLNTAAEYFRTFYTLDASLYNSVKNLESPIIYYIKYQMDSINIDALHDYSLKLLNTQSPLNEEEMYFLVKSMYELLQKNKIQANIMDSSVNLYLTHYPYGKHASRIYYFLFTSGKIKKDTIAPRLMELIVRHSDDPYALRFIPLFADTTIKGNKKRRLLKNFLKRIGSLPVNSTVLQLSFYLPEICEYMNPADTSNVYKRNFLEEFGSPPHLVKLWSNSELITYHFARGYMFKQKKEYNKAIKEFEACDAYNQPHYLKEEKDKQIIAIYKQIGKYRSTDCQKVALDLLSKNPTDTVAQNVLSNMPQDSISTLLIKLLRQHKKQLDGNIKFTLLNGKTLKKKDLKGKVWIIKFWSVYCPHCRKEIPFENELFNDLKKDNDIGLLACSTNSKEEVQKFLKNNEFLFTHAYGCNKLRKYLPVSGVPAYFILNNNAEIVFSHIGESPDIKARLKKEIELAKMI